MGIQFTEENLASIKAGIQETFESICEEQPILRDKGNGKEFDGIISSISFVGKASVIMAIGLPKQTAIGITSKFVGFELDYESSDMTDIVKELANILGGDLSARLIDLGFENQISLPNIISGNHIRILLSEASNSTLLNYKTSAD